MHVIFLVKEKILVVVIESRNEKELFKNRDILARELLKYLRINEQLTDFTMEYYEGKYAVCVWSKDIELQNTFLFRVIAQLSLAGYSNWYRTAMTIWDE